MQVYNNSPIFSVWKNYTGCVSNLRGAMTRLSSDQQTMTPQTADGDSEGLSDDDRMRAQYRNSAAEAGKLESNINSLQTADAWLEKMRDIVAQMGDMASLAAHGESGADPAESQNAFERLRQEALRVAGKLARHGHFAGPSAEDAGQEAPLEDSASISWVSLVGDPDLNISSETAANDALGKLSSAIAQIDTGRAAIGEQTAAMEEALANLRSHMENLRAIESHIIDVDVAQEATQSAKYSIVTQIGTAMLAQANAFSDTVINLTR